MAKRKKDPSEKILSDFFNVFGGDDGIDDVLHYTPAPKEPIEVTAPIVVKMMKEMKKDAEIHFKDFILEVGRRLDEEDIIESYYEALDTVKEILAERRKAANNNKPKKPKGPKGPK